MIDRRRYRKVFVRIWNNPEFLSLTDSERLLTLYLLSGPQTNRVGLFRVSFALAAEDLQTTTDTLTRRLKHVIDAFNWQFDPRVKVLWIPSWWSFNTPGDNEKNWKGCLSDLNDVPRTPLISKFCNTLVSVPELMHHLFAEWNTVLSPIEHRSNTDTITDRTQEQEQEQEKEQECMARDEPRAAASEDQTLGTGGFIRRFCEVYSKYRHGARYHVVRTKHVPLVRSLLRTHGPIHLEKLAIVLLTATADPWLDNTDRGIEVLNAKINWLEDRLRTYEAEHGEIRIAS